MVVRLNGAPSLRFELPCSTVAAGKGVRCDGKWAGGDEP